MQTDDLEHIEETAAMWCHRTRISIEHLIHELNEHSPDTTAMTADGSRPMQYQILQMFLQEVCNLDPFPTFLLKRCIDQLIHPITTIINYVNAELCCDDFKQDLVKPLIKKNLLKMN